MKGTMIGILFALTGNIGAPFFGCCLGGMLIPFLNTKERPQMISIKNTSSSAA